MHKRYEGKWGFIDTNGRFVISPRFTDAGRFVGRLADVTTSERWLDSRRERYGYINPSGDFVIPEQFDRAGDFDAESGLAVACLGSGDDQRCGYIDRNGKFAINPQFYGAWDFGFGLARVYRTKGSEPSWVSPTGQILWDGDVEEWERGPDGKLRPKAGGVSWK